MALPVIPASGPIDLGSLRGGLGLTVATGMALLFVFYKKYFLYIERSF